MMNKKSIQSETFLSERNYESIDKNMMTKNKRRLMKFQSKSKVRSFLFLLELMVFSLFIWILKSSKHNVSSKSIYNKNKFHNTFNRRDTRVLSEKEDQYIKNPNQPNYPHRDLDVCNWDAPYDREKNPCAIPQKDEPIEGIQIIDYVDKEEEDKLKHDVKLHLAKQHYSLVKDIYKPLQAYANAFSKALEHYADSLKRINKALNLDILRTVICALLLIQPIILLMKLHPEILVHIPINIIISMIVFKLMYRSIRNQQESNE
ncbi:Plasmodium exported protein, unknown function [Plasmodium sp. gorilla clade G2]|uniref:Plasmodium exported protein, unknown function n=1 Tax=Plasmodium sp. gorilla clade G2 TaxID=880535 RepID=UPI000D267750|nr:Plasmodium exported protein, unknown function [Plasmodium sp. gorilla clade G2]SOV20369.1 Plasmodium exported protein, unknown function [Plasmodium sp. gorilla clade G2]